MKTDDESHFRQSRLTVREKAGWGWKPGTSLCTCSRKLKATRLRPNLPRLRAAKKQSARVDGRFVPSKKYKAALTIAKLDRLGRNVTFIAN